MKVKFANTSQYGEIITPYGDTLYASSLRYLKPEIYFNTKQKSAHSITLMCKLIKPDGSLSQNSSSPKGYTYALDIYIPKHGRNLSRKGKGWGNSDKSVYTSGTYRYEIWHEGKKIYDTSFTIYLTPSEIQMEREYAEKAYMDIQKVEFANVEKNGNKISPYGSTLYASEMRYLSPKIYYNGKCAERKNVTLFYKIIKPDGTVSIYDSSPNGFSSTWELTIEPGNGKTTILPGWGSSNASIYTSGTYQYELWYKERKIYGTSVTLHRTEAENLALQSSNKTTSNTVSNKTDSQKSSQTQNKTTAKVPTGGDLVQQGKTQLESKQYASAFNTFKKSAAGGNAAAMYYLGLCHEYGYGTQQDIYEAMDWYLKAADKGDGDACFRVAKAYANGYVLVGSDAQKVDYSRKSAQAGCAAGMEYYAQLLSEGRYGVKKDLNEAKRYFQMAMDKNFEDAFCTMAQYLYHGWYGYTVDKTKSKQYLDKLKSFKTARGYNQLAYMYLDGSAGVKSQREAYNYFLKSANLGFAWSEYEIGLMYEGGNSEASVTMSEQQALSWYERAYKHGYTVAARRIGYIYENKAQYSQALEWYYKAGFGSEIYHLLVSHRNLLSQSDVLNKLTKMANKGNYWAQRIFGDMYYNGTGVAKSLNESFKWFYAAATNPNSNDRDGGLFNDLGNLYYRGEGTSRSYSEAAKWYRKGAECIFSSGWPKYNLANCYLNGQGVTANDYTGFRWMLASAETGLTAAMNAVALFYIQGRGTSKNYNEAFKWCKKSAEKNDAEGQYLLSLCYLNGYGTQKNINLAKEYLTRSANQGVEPAKQILQQLYRNNPNANLNNWMNMWMNAAQNMKYDFSNINSAPSVPATSYPSSSSSYNSSSGTPTRKTCPDCHGKRFQPQSYYDCATSTSYFNYAGNVCPICNLSTKHCHYPCVTCQQRGTVESY